jgi:hypothetical protein
LIAPECLPDGECGWHSSLRRPLFPGGGYNTRSLQLPSGGIRPPPSEGLKGGEVPQLHRPLFWLKVKWQVGLHEQAGRVMLLEG